MTQINTLSVANHASWHSKESRQQFRKRYGERASDYQNIALAAIHKVRGHNSLEELPHLLVVSHYIAKLGVESIECLDFQHLQEVENLLTQEIFEC